VNAALSVTLYINCTGEPVVDLIEAGVHSRELGVALLEEITDDGLLGEKAMDFCEPTIGFELVDFETFGRAERAAKRLGKIIDMLEYGKIIGMLKLIVDAVKLGSDLR
jgi:hypothetical protein